MPRKFSLLCFLFMLLFAPAYSYAADTETLAGNWTSLSHDGVLTQLEVEENGKFIFRQQHSQDLRRSYMCGSLTDEGNSLELEIQAYKERKRDGQVEEAIGAQFDSIPVSSRSGSRLVVTIGQKTVVLELRG